MNIIFNMEEVSGQSVFHMSTLSSPGQDELAISFTEHRHFEQLAVLAETIQKQLKGGHMKLKNLFWFATGAGISYHLVKNRKSQKPEVTESSQ